VMRSTILVKHDACLVEIADSSERTRAILPGCLGAPRSRVVLASPAIIGSRPAVRSHCRTPRPQRHAGNVLLLSIP
jgi:hypothetical protein